MPECFPHLFQPMRMGYRQSRNRLMRLAMSTNTGENGVITDKAIDAYWRVACGGGVLVTEGMRVYTTTESRPREFLLFCKEIVPTLARMAETIHD